MNLYILIVLYKKDSNRSKAYQTLKELQNRYSSNNFKINFIIWNNSPEIQFEKDNFEYHEAQNTTLPIIYNAMAKKYLNSENDFLMISDDDTDYSNYDFRILFDILITNKNQTGIFIPQLYANKKLVSPATRILFKGKYLNQVQSGFINSGKILGMNSGVIISYKCYETMPFLFDERLNFYATDTDFFIRYETYFKTLFVLPFQIIHSLSSYDKKDKLSDFRLNDSIYGLKIINENKPLWEKGLLTLYIIYLKTKALF